METFWAAPPVSRTITALTFIQSTALYGGVLSGYWVIWVPRLIFQVPPQIWRLALPFFITGPKLSFIFDLYHMYTYGSALETSSVRFSRPGDFVTYLVFVALVIMLTAGYILGGVVFTSALILAMVYTYAQDNRGRKVYFFFVQMPVQYLPYAMLFITLLQQGWPSALSESMGIVAAHAYDFVTHIYPTYGGGRNWLVTPGFVHRFFSNTSSRSYGTASRQPEPRSTGPSTSRGWTSSFQNPWSNRGAGRRLGGN
ncbi:hypothetical protein N7532_007427 [Penicillium argentinense]|uniref:Derlin n=1 Tax=Penicillium argentinense TaxID=1131581 RepID=A0A9W9F7N6_9EURO|nr:uncharacterized protein N7532_007427 [Penicillium argentinense]KAJ5095136.1 hypothetical protein N7532_007427 [Penicillium argentinense]